MKWGWGSDCHQKMAQVQVFFALGPATYFKALSGPVPHQCLLGKPGSSVRNHLPTGQNHLLSSEQVLMPSSYPRPLKPNFLGVRHRHRHFFKAHWMIHVQPGLETIGRFKFKYMETEACKGKGHGVSYSKAEAGPGKLASHTWSFLHPVFPGARAPGWMTGPKDN